MVGLGAAGHLRVLELDEIADVVVLAEHGAGPQPRERADLGVGPDHGELAVAADDMGVLADLDIAKGGVGPDHSPGRDRAGAQQLGVGQDGDIGCQVYVGLDPSRLRVEHGDTFTHPVLD